MLIQSSPLKWLLALSGGVGALVTIWGGVSLVRPVLASDSAPLASIDRVAELKQESVRTFGQIQSQSHTDEQATSASFCALFSKLAAEADAMRAKHPTDANAIQDAALNDGQRDLWCRKAMGR